MVSRNIPKFLRDEIKHRQKNNCACCLNKGFAIHHIRPYSITKKHIGTQNLILLCKNHHNLFHLGDTETFQSVYEYSWFLQKGTIPEHKDLAEISEEVNDFLNKRSNLFD